MAPPRMLHMKNSRAAALLQAEYRYAEHSTPLLGHGCRHIARLYLLMGVIIGGTVVLLRLDGRL